MMMASLPVASNVSERPSFHVSLPRPSRLPAARTTNGRTRARALVRDLSREGEGGVVVVRGSFASGFRVERGRLVRAVGRESRRERGRDARRGERAPRP